MDRADFSNGLAAGLLCGFVCGVFFTLILMVR